MDSCHVRSFSRIEAEPRKIRWNRYPGTDHSYPRDRFVSLGSRGDRFHSRASMSGPDYLALCGNLHGTT
jgi:hypothetical protein